MTLRRRSRWLLASLFGALLLLPSAARAERPATIDLAQGQRTMFVGRDTRAVAALGDVNGDDRGDYAMTYLPKVGTRLAFPEHVAVRFGRPEPAGARIVGPDLADIEFVPPGVPHSFSVHDVQAAGDVNGDGLDDIAIAVQDRTFPSRVPPAPGQPDFGDNTPDFAYVVFGGPARVIHPEALGAQGFRIVDSAGTSFRDLPRIRSAGDVNGDGLDDLIATRVNNRGSTAWVVFGKQGAQADVDLADLGTGGVRLEVPVDPGTNPILVAVTGAGDLNDDGLDDVAVAYNDHRAAPACGFTDCFSVAVVFGDRDLGGRTINLRALGTAGYRAVLDGAAAGGTISDIAPVGDYNGDGIDDLAIGAMRRLKDRATSFADTVFVLLGGAAPRTTVLLDDLGDAVVAIGYAPGSADRTFGDTVRAAGDFNKDGLADILVGARAAERTVPTAGAHVGAAFVIFGRRGGPPIADVRRLRPTEGVRIEPPLKTTPFGDAAGFASSLGGLGDIDGDGAVDLLISHRGYRAHATAGGSDDDNNDLLAGGVYLLSGEADTDGDGLTDAWETRGIDFDGDGTVDLRPSELGARPRHKDVFVEMDAMVGHVPDPEGVVDVIKAFERAPVTNPDGRTGIDLHVEFDDGIPHADGITMGNVRVGGVDDMDDLKTRWFGTADDRAAGPARLAAKRLVSHYALWVHGFRGQDVGGLGTLFGSNMGLVNRFSGPAANGDNPITPEDQASTFMHELGHNLGLDHGGGDAVNCKPNYPSVMNYTSSHPGLLSTYRLDYSRTTLATLDEAALDESVAINGDPGLLAAFGPTPIVVEALAGTHDYNRNGRRDDGAVAADLNNLGTTGCGGAGTVLAGYDDWSNLRYDLRNGTDAKATGGVARPPAFPQEATNAQLRELSGDADQDGVNDFDDNCRGVANAGQADTDHDGRGDGCDATTGPAAPPAGPPLGGGMLDPPMPAGPPGVTPSPTDRTAPAITRFARTRRGFSFRLSEPATVTLTLERRQGRRYRRVARLTIRGRTGENVARYAKKLRSARYRATITATDADRNRSPVKRLAFRR